MKISESNLRTAARSLFMYKNPGTWLLSRLHLHDGEVFLKLRSGQIFLIAPRKHEASLLDDVFTNNDYITALNTPRAGATIIDIGANVGAFSILAMRFRPYRIYSFEPCAETYGRLCKNIELNDAQGVVEAFPFAVAGSFGRKNLLCNPKSSGANMLGAAGTQEGWTSEPVDAITLRDVFEKFRIGHCDLLKMDVEGTEYEILRNTPGVYFDRIDHIAMEYHGDAGEIKNVLEQRGFDITMKDPSILYADKPGREGHR